MKTLYLLFFTLVLSSSSYCQIVINEVDVDSPGSDTAEFIELLWTPTTSLDGYVVVLFNGGDDQSYAAFDLDGYSTDANGFFILANTSLVSVGDYEIPPGASGKIQNGPDAVAVYQDDASNWPNDTAMIMTNLIDAVIYDTNDGDDAGLLAGLGETTQYNEDENGAKDTESIQRINDGTYITKATTFRAINNILSTTKTQIKGFKLYPNPSFNGLINISSNNNAVIRIAVYNILGKQVINTIVSNKHLDVSILNAGIYIIKVTQDNSSVTKKLVVK